MASTYFFVFIALFSLVYFNDGVKADCGESIDKAYGTIKSPIYFMENPSMRYCQWNIKIPPNKNISLYFKKFQLEESSLCLREFVRIRSLTEEGTYFYHGKFCGSQINNFTISGIKLHIRSRIDHSNEFKGFELDFYTVPFDCSELLEESEGIITSSRLPLPYLPNLNCSWTIQAPLNTIIKLRFTDFDTKDSFKCVQEYVTVQSEMLDDEIREHGKFCGLKTPPAIVSESNIMLIKFKSPDNKGGFNATFISGECGGLIEGGKGNISSPFFPDLYPPNTMCEWKFIVPPQHKIKLNFLKFEVEGGLGCPSDFLKIESISAHGKVFEYGKYCGHFGPSLISSKERIIMTFVSDRSSEKKGFMVEYVIDELTDFESSVLSKKSTRPLENNYDDIAEDFVTSSNEENTSFDKYDSTISSAMTTRASYDSNQPKTEKQQKDTEDVIMSITNILSAQASLTKKIADMEGRQIMLFKHYENMFNNFGKSVSILQRMLESQQ